MRVSSEKYYATISKGYNELYGEEQLKKFEIIKPFIKGRVLDVGCGTGLITEQIPNSVGLDNCPEMLEQFNGEKVLGDAHKLPFPDNSFDTVISITVLQDLDDPVKALKEMKRVGRRVIFTVLHKGKWSEKRLKKVIREAGLSGEIIKSEKDWIFIQS